MAADHVANVEFGDVVVGHVDQGVALFGEFGDQLVARLITAAAKIEADKDMGVAVVGVAVVEFGDAAFAECLAELAEAAGLFSNVGCVPRTNTHCA